MSRSATLYVRNLSHQARHDDLKDLFSRYGRVLDVAVPVDYRSGNAKGYAFVQFDSSRDAKHAMERTFGMRFMGRMIETELAKGIKKTPQEMRERNAVLARHGGRSPNRRYDRRRSPSFERRGGRRRSPSFDGRGSDRRRSPSSGGDRRSYDRRRRDDFDENGSDYDGHRRGGERRRHQQPSPRSDRGPSSPQVGVPMVRTSPSRSRSRSR